ncbi:MFS transporter [Actinomycetospora cinnamomea]|uniref:MFS transporter n=1 Tax=Actinomycetospora cinnamomea TaxID=663609 RepID=UPI001FAF068B|nr:MFS transporter [Actinomycetospora cinnamomea]
MNEPADTRTPAAGTAAGRSAEESGAPGRYRALVLATLGMTVNFWAWSLLNPLGPQYRELLGLSPFALSVAVAVPVLVGSLGRIPLGAATDRFGGRIVFAALSAVAILPVLFLALFDSYPALLAGGLVLGLAGASFAVGIPFVNAWFPPHQRGFALGVYGVGNAGTALSNFFTPRIWAAQGPVAPFLLVAALLALTAVAFIAVGRNAPGWQPATAPFWPRFRQAIGLRLSIDLAALYAITFGGFVAFGVYLPTYLRDTYELEVADAAARAAGFVVLATLTRPLGGWLADRRPPHHLIVGALAVVAVGAVVAAFGPHIALATVAFLAIAAALGLANGAIFALVGQRVPASQVGSVTGVVGAAGGLGGFLPPIVMGAVYQATDDYAIGLMLLSDVALAGLVYAAWRFGSRTASVAA